MSNLVFAKYHGCGNDFILIDDRKKRFFSCQTIPNLCCRYRGIGADGVILLQDSGIASYRMRFFNADGKEASFCGNGLRCLAKFIDDAGLLKAPLHIETQSGIKKIVLKKDSVAIDMGSVQELECDLTLKPDLIVDVIDSGVPHALVHVSSIEDVPVEDLGSFIRNHVQFKPHGVNATFFEIQSKNTLNTRTFERGVERETQSCGTGALAAAYVAQKKHAVSDKVCINTRHGDRLFVSKDKQGALWLEGIATHVFSGVTSLNQLSRP